MREKQSLVVDGLISFVFSRSLLILQIDTEAPVSFKFPPGGAFAWTRAQVQNGSAVPFEDDVTWFAPSGDVRGFYAAGQIRPLFHSDAVTALLEPHYYALHCIMIEVILKSLIDNCKMIEFCSQKIIQLRFEFLKLKN